MYAKSIKYTDFNGVEREEVHHFNLTQAEITEMELSTNGGLDQYIHNIIAAQDGAEIIALFKQLICKSYGVKSLDGKYFHKRPEDLENFMATEAFSVLYMELATDTKAATEFVNGITPKMPEDHKKPNGPQAVTSR